MSELHSLAKKGDIKAVQAALAGGADVNAQDETGFTPLMFALIFHPQNSKLHQCFIEGGADLEIQDEFENTILLYACEYNAHKTLKMLLDAGADIDVKNNYDGTPMSEANGVEVIRILQSHGADINELDNDMRRELLGLTKYKVLECTEEEYKLGKNRRFGSRNPEEIHIGFWRAMVFCGFDAYQAKREFRDEDYPIWCYDRFGTSMTELPDGRFVLIAGEHEDGYDPDFCIYNDVVVFNTNGDFTIYAYPKAVFPPTDQHSATLVGDDIYIIGSVGYMGERGYKETPVYRLSTKTFKIEKVETTGQYPGWIFKHKAEYKDDNTIHIKGGELCVVDGDKEDFIKNTKEFSLNLNTYQWKEINA